MRPMSETTVIAFWDELEKIAVNTLDLLRAVRKAPNVQIGRSLQAAVGGGGITQPAGQVAERLVSSRQAPAREALGRARGFFSRLPSSLRQRGEAAAEGFEGILDAQAQAARANPNAGRIDVDPGVVTQAFSGMAGLPAGSRMAQRGAMGATTAAHELFERGVKARDVAPLYSHIAPEVLLKEHNMISRLEGPGSDYARRAFRGTREFSGEAEHMGNLLEQAFDPRARQFLGEGQKVPKAMRKALRKKLRKNPELIAQSTPKKKGLMERLRRAPERVRRSTETQRRMMEAIQDRLNSGELG